MPETSSEKGPEVSEVPKSTEKCRKVPGILETSGPADLSALCLLYEFAFVGFFFIVFFFVDAANVSVKRAFECRPMMSVYRDLHTIIVRYSNPGGVNKVIKSLYIVIFP